MALALAVFLALPLAAGADETRRYDLALYHFNIEFIAGSRSAEDAIVTESFDPLLDLYLRHPTWGADLELQGYMIEVLAQRHPAVLEKLRALVAAGSVELICCHYSDQLVLAFPHTDLVRGLVIDDRLLARHGLRRAPVIFFQEGQFGAGLLEYLRRNGRAVAVAPAGTYDFSQPGDAAAPLLASRGVVVVPGDTRRYSAPDGTRIEAVWTRLGDGEPAATGSNPYGLKKAFRFDPAVLGGLEHALEAQAAAGVRIVSVSEYVRQVRALGVEPAACKPYFDTPWKGERTGNVFLWMGRHDQPLEDDVGIHTDTVRARLDLLRAEGVLRAEGKDPRVLEEGWKHLLKSEVTDATGWVPLPIEMRYAREHAAAAAAAARLVQGPEDRWVDTQTGVYVDPPERLAHEPAAGGPVAVHLRQATGKVTWALLGGGIWEVQVAFRLLPWKLARAAVAFPVTEPVVRYSPAGLDGEVAEVPWDAVGVKGAWLALPNGLVGLGHDLWLIQDHAQGFACCHVTPGEAAFEVEGGARLSHDWRFLVVRGWRQALVMALRTNVCPVVPAFHEE